MSKGLHLNALGSPLEPKDIKKALEKHINSAANKKGNGAVTRQMLEHVNKTPEIRASLNNNPYIPTNAAARMQRDAEWADRFGPVRPEIQNARNVISQGPGWIDRLEAILRQNPAALPAIVGGAGLAPFALRQSRDGS
jgi:hypothetical protein